MRSGYAWITQLCDELHSQAHRFLWCSDVAIGVEGSEEAVEGGAEEEGEQDFGDEVAGEEEDAGAGEGGEAGVEGGAGVEGLVGPAVAEEREEKDADGLGEVGGEGVEAEDAEAEGDEPVGERRFFEVADAVDVEGDEIAGEAMWRAALAWVASASSSRGGVKSAAKKMMSQRPLRMKQSGGAAGGAGARALRGCSSEVSGRG